MRRSKYNKGKKPPTFITKLFKLIEDPENWEYIRWTDDEQSFIILNISKFGEKILPKEFKHSNYSSFVRQLNMYNFIKVRTELEGQHIFKNQLFYRQNVQNFKDIHRKQVIAPGKNTIVALSNETSQLNNLAGPSSSSLSDQNSVQMMRSSSSQIPMFQLFEGFKNISLSSSLSDYMKQTHQINCSIPPQISDYSPSSFPTIPMGYPGFQSEISQQSSKMIEQMKQSQSQLQEICVSLYTQNQRLTQQNEKLQHKLSNQYKKKDIILNQIISYVVSYLWQWNSAMPTSNLEKGDKMFKHQNSSQDQSQPIDAVLESYKTCSNQSKLNKSEKQRKSQKTSSDNKFNFSKHAKNQKKILMALIQQIQKSYNVQPSMSRQSKFQGNFRQKCMSEQSSANNFLLSMLMKFIESNNLTQVIKRFSTLVNLGRNKKSKNFTIVNCMKDLRDQFGHSDHQMSIIDQQLNQTRIQTINTKKMILESEKKINK